MKTSIYYLVFVLVLGAAMNAYALASAVADAQKQMDDGHYNEALKIITAAFNALPRNTDAPDRYSLLMLRGEAMLHTGASTAASVFDSAAYAATDIKDIAPARATAMLIRASSQGKYHPKSGSDPIDIVDPASRKLAFVALREDMATSVHAQLEKVLAGQTLPPMLDVLPKVLDLGYLEYSADGTLAKTREDLHKLGTRARELIEPELRRLRTRAEIAQSVSNSISDGNARGLHSDERDSLRNDVTYLKQIEKTARDARRRANELGFDGKAWEPIAADAADLAEHDQAILEFIP